MVGRSIFIKLTASCKCPVLVSLSLVIYLILTTSYFIFVSSALVWGSSVKYNPQKVGKDHVLQDEDVVQIVKK